MDKLKILIFVSVVFLTVIGCKKNRDNFQQTVLSQKIPPVALAGADQVLLLPIDSTILSGKGTDADGTIIKYEWSKVRGPAAFSFPNVLNSTAKLNGLTMATYIFTLKVTDNDGLTASDNVSVIVWDGDPCAGCWDY
jgi:hypothetical protein